VISHVDSGFVAISSPLNCYFCKRWLNEVEGLVRLQACPMIRVCYSCLDLLQADREQQMRRGQD
jgi:hypothetical protein